MRVVVKNTLLLSMLLMTLVACATTTDTITGPNKPAAKINTELGANYLRLGNLELADQKLRRALKQDPNYATANWVFALLQERLGENTEADKYFRKAISLNPKDSKAHNNYGTFLCNQNRIKQAEKEFLLAVENPLYVQADAAYANAGKCLLKIPDKAKAEEYFKKSLQTNPAQRSALYQMAKVSFERQEFSQATHYIQRYEQVGKHNSKSLWIGYQSATKLGYKAKADDYAHQLKRLFPASKEARLLAEAYWHAGKAK